MYNLEFTGNNTQTFNIYDELPRTAKEMYKGNKQISLLWGPWWKHKAALRTIKGSYEDNKG